MMKLLGLGAGVTSNRLTDTRTSTESSAKRATLLNDQVESLITRVTKPNLTFRKDLGQFLHCNIHFHFHTGRTILITPSVTQSGKK